MGMLNIYGTEREKNCGALEGAIHKTEQDAFSEGELFISHVSGTSISSSKHVSSMTQKKTTFLIVSNVRNSERPC